MSNFYNTVLQRNRLSLVNLVQRSEAMLQVASSLYISEKYQDAAIIYCDYLLQYPNDPDIMHNYACILFMQKKYDEAVSFFKRSVLKICSYHAIYHFFCSALYCNRGSIRYLVNDINNAKLDLIQSEFLYHENKAARLGILNIDNMMTYALQDPCLYLIQNCDIAGSLPIFGNHYLARSCHEASRLYRDKAYDSAICLYTKIIKDIEMDHFLYHCAVARQMFNRGLCFMELQLLDVAIFDLRRALELDAKNPDNIIISQCIQKLLLLTK